MKPEYIICHYAEIGLKGKNRKFFEEKLVENIKKAIEPAFFKSVRRISGRILIKLTDKSAEKQKKIKGSLKKVFGIAYFAFSQSCEQKIEAIQKKALEILKTKKFKSFRISAKRSEEGFPFGSQEVNEKVGEWVVKNLKKKVDLEKPEATCFIELVEKFAFLYTERTKGPGGLPVTVSGKAVALLSGGIDSPVAIFQIMKRGVKVIFLHFHSYPYTNQASIGKVERIAKILNKFQFNSKLYLIPFANIQREILLKTPAKLRVILYRRFMFRIAEEIAKKEKALAIVTGESVGQVASQTLENIKAIERSVELPIFRPLIGQDKEEIIKKAKEIETFEISILPHQDCCARFLPKHPETKAKIGEVEKAEKKLNIEKLVDQAVKKSSLKKI